MPKNNKPEESESRKANNGTQFNAGRDIVNVQTGERSVMNVGAPSQAAPKPKSTSWRTSLIGLGIFAVVFLAAKTIANPTPFQYIVCRFGLAMAAMMCIEPVLSGSLSVKIDSKINGLGIGIRATGLAAFFVLAYFFNPASPHDFGLPTFVESAQPGYRTISNTAASTGLRHIHVVLLTANPQMTDYGEPNLSVSQIRATAEKRFGANLDSAYIDESINVKASLTLTGTITRHGEGYPIGILATGSATAAQTKIATAVFAGTRFPVPINTDRYGIAVQVSIHP